METWRDVPGFEDTYLVSDSGRVARIMKAPPTSRYHRINVNIGDKVRTFLAHVWVLEAFVGPRPEGQLARHLNDNPQDNRLENLQWGTPAENVQDAITNGGRTLITKCKLGHELAGNNLQVKGRRCKACNQERANAHWHNRDFSPERANQRYEELMCRT